MNETLTHFSYALDDLAKALARAAAQGLISGDQYKRATQMINDASALQLEIDQNAAALQGAR